ncbi:hypothetical protein GCM10010270_50710 [Streptomyces violaceus]|nr:hypothetical protein GCM10010270_50710 [Streptomyces janthinus]
MVLQDAQIPSYGLLGHAQLGGERGDVDSAVTSCDKHDLALTFFRGPRAHPDTCLPLALPVRARCGPWGNFYSGDAAVTRSVAGSILPACARSARGVPVADLRGP